MDRFRRKRRLPVHDTLLSLRHGICRIIFPDPRHLKNEGMAERAKWTEGMIV
jgi:hypothetical protein